jgi:tetratricopeptide (TPR) repeat protein
MEQKEKFYLDVLELEPGSRLFYPLSEIYVRQKRLEEARDVLVQGLKYHPGHFEARLLLASVYDQLGETDRSLEIVREMFSSLKARPFFWKLLLQEYREAGREEIALALQILAAESREKPLSLAGIMQEGLKSLLNDAPGESPFPEKGSAHENKKDEPAKEPQEESTIPDSSPEDDQESKAQPEEPFALDEDAEEVEDLDLEETAWTRSMADVLYRQEEYEQALRIYRHLWSSAMPGPERRELEELISDLEEKLGVGGEQDGGDKASEGETQTGDANETDPFMQTLHRLAERLEQRAEQ